MKEPKIILIVLISTLTMSLYGQNDLLHNQYMFNEVSFNPAVAGNTAAIESKILARQQWLGFNEAPSTQVFNINGYLRNIGGMGFNVSNDKLGNENTLDAKVAYAHYIQVSPKSVLSFGMAAGFISKTIDGQNLVYADGDDENAIIHKETRLKPDFNAGVEYNSTYLTLGVSATHIHQSLLKANNFCMPRHYYVYAKGRIEASDKVNIVPTFLIKSSAFITQYDINALLFYDNRVWLGASYRINEAYIGMLGFQINKKLKFGYAYDFSTGPAKLYNIGSHEIMLSYYIKNNKNRIHMRSPRFFN